MNRQEAIAMYRSLSEEFGSVRADMDRLSKRASGLAKLLSGIEELFPEVLDLPTEDNDGSQDRNQVSVATVPRTSEPRGQEAVLLILQEHGGWLTVTEIAQILEERGWSPDATDVVAAARTAVSRAYQKTHEVFRRKRGRAYLYRYRPGDQDSDMPDHNGDEDSGAAAEAETPETLSNQGGQ